MINLDIAHQRLHNQHITQRTLETPQALVEWLGAVQAQDFAAAKWALGLRLLGTYPSRQRRYASTAVQSVHTILVSLNWMMLCSGVLMLCWQTHYKAESSSLVTNSRLHFSKLAL